MCRVLEPQPSHFWTLDLIKECFDGRFTLSANLVGCAFVSAAPPRFVQRYPLRWLITLLFLLDPVEKQTLVGN